MLFSFKNSFRFWDIQILEFQCLKCHGVNSVHWSITPPSQKHHLPLSCQAPSLNLQIVQALPPPFQAIPPPDIGFSRNPLKIGFFHESQKYCFSFLTSSYFYTVIKFSVKISHFEYLVMTEKNIFVYKLFCQFKFYVKSSPPEKGHPLLRTNHPLKTFLKTWQEVPYIWYIHDRRFRIFDPYIW